jgi:hypothetical protein
VWMRRAGVAFAAAVFCGVTLTLGWGGPSGGRRTYPRTFTPAYSDSAVDAFILVERPEPPDDYFPCSDCHEPGDEVNTRLRVLEEEHEDKTLVHGESAIWCLDCHDRQERDHLHAASGNPIPFEQSHKLCGQCHGRMYQEWKRGVHGKRIGNWLGEKRYFVCVACHNPHDPAFHPLEPMPPPLRPEEYR